MARGRWCGLARLVRAISSIRSVFLLFSESETKTIVLAIDRVRQCLEAAIMIEVPRVLGSHEKPALTHENAC
jgi:hypothetical protein